MGQFFNSPQNSFDDTLVPPSRNDALEQSRFVTGVFGWMTVGLAITGFISLLVAQRPKLVMDISNMAPLIFVFQIVLILGLLFGINRISAGLATILFLVFSASMGLTLSVIFILYTRASIESTFFITSATFGGMAFYGYVTKRDLTSIGHIAGMALWGLIIAMFVSMFLHISGLNLLINVAGVLIFVALTAYDTQKIKYMYLAGAEGSQENHKAAIIGALELYLDFLNLFLFLLQLFARERD